MIQYNVCNIEKMSRLDSLSSGNLAMMPFQTHNYDIAYMFQRYSLKPQNFVQWFIDEMNLSGYETAVELGCLSKAYWINNLQYINLFQRLYLVDFEVEHILQTKRLLSHHKNINYKLKQSAKLDIPNKSVDLVYSNQSDFTLEHANSELLLGEINRILKDEGIFYYSVITEDYYASIYRLVMEYKSDFSTDIINKYVNSDFGHIKQILFKTFEKIETKEFQSQWWVDNVDDLIGFILCDPELKEIKQLISKTGLSKFRVFLLNKIISLGGISLVRSVSLMTCSQKCIFS